VASCARLLRLRFFARQLGAAFIAYAFVCTSSVYAQETAVPQEIVTPKNVSPIEEQEPAAPVDITPPASNIALKKDVNVPLPPEKPEGLMSVTSPDSKLKPQKDDAIKDEVIAPTVSPQSEAQALTAPDAKSEEPVIDASIPLPPVKPQFDLPLPPSMIPPKVDEKDEEGAEEGASDGVEKQVDSVELACIEPAVMDIVKKAGAFFRAVPIITSGYRSRGRRGSLHRQCKAVDFIVPGVSTHTLANYLKALPEAGGVGTYCHTKSVHIDVGEPRNWGYCGFRRIYFSMR
jgi:Peptidase M15